MCDFQPKRAHLNFPSAFNGFWFNENKWDLCDGPICTTQIKGHLREHIGSFQLPFGVYLHAMKKPIDPQPHLKHHFQQRFGFLFFTSEHQLFQMSFQLTKVQLNKCGDTSLSLGFSQSEVRLPPEEEEEEEEGWRRVNESEQSVGVTPRSQMMSRWSESLRVKSSKPHYSFPLRSARAN